MDYVNWTSRTTNPEAIPFKDGQKIHVVLISDEENVKKFETTDAYTGAVTSSKDLICYHENKITKNCEISTVPKTFKESSWIGYGFKVTIPATPTYTYDFDYQPMSTCQALGAASYPDGSDNLVRLYGLRRCHKTQRECRDTNQITNNYSC